MRYFLTGATGFLGGRVARQLVAEGHEVVAVARDPASAGDLAALGVSLHGGDVTEKESMRAAMTGVDGVFHIAGWYKIGMRDTSPGVKINVDGTRNVLELMRELAIPKGVYTSTVAVYSDTHGRLVDESYRYDGPHLSEYDRTKWVAHYEVAEPMIAAGLPLVIAQPGVIYGPGDTSSIHDLFVSYLRRKLPGVPKRTAYCWAHVDDIAQGHLRAMAVGVAGQSYNLAGPPATIIEALAIAQRITGVPAPKRLLAPGLVRVMSRTMGVVGAVIPLPQNFSAEYLRVSAGVTYLGDATKAREALGFAPRGLEEGLTETLRDEMKQLGMRGY
jgi:nucleoside-diphosphate-sugar epimerase